MPFGAPPDVTVYEEQHSATVDRQLLTSVDWPKTLSFTLPFHALEQEGKEKHSIIWLRSVVDILMTSAKRDHNSATMWCAHQWPGSASDLFLILSWNWMGEKSTGVGQLVVLGMANDNPLSHVPIASFCGARLECVKFGCAWKGDPKCLNWAWSMFATNWTIYIAHTVTKITEACWA